MTNKVSFFKLHNLSLAFGRILETFVLYFFGAALLFSLYSLSNESVFLIFISELKTGLQPIALIDTKSGPSSKRTTIDSLWLPTNEKQIVHVGDSIFTKDEATLGIKLNENAKLFVEPNSYLRIRKVDGLPLIKLSQGVVKAEVMGEQTILIKKGATIEKVILQKGTYFIKNELSSGIQITAYTQNTNLTQGETEKSNKVKNSTPDNTEAETETPDQSKNVEATKEKLNLGSSKEDSTDFDLPTPVDGTLFLVKNPKDIVVGSMARCPDTCRMKIYFNEDQTIVDVNLKQNDPGLIILKSSQLQEGYFECMFETQTSQFKSNFKIRKFSEDALSEAILTETPVEIHP